MFAIYNYLCIVITLILIFIVQFHEFGPDFPDQSRNITQKTVFVTFNVASHHTVSIRGSLITSSVDLISRKENFALKNWTTIGCIRQPLPFSDPLFSNRGDLKTPSVDPSIFDHSQYLKNPGPGVATIWKLESLEEFNKVFEVLYFPNSMNNTNRMGFMGNVDFILVKNPPPSFISNDEAQIQFKLKTQFIVVLISEEDWCKLPQEGTTVFISRKIGRPKFKCHFQECIKDRAQGTYLLKSAILIS